ncbi:MAG: helix-turn-helix domain-containing protein [Planctomycetota bacterium]
MFMDANARLGQWLVSLTTHLSPRGQEHPTSWAGRARRALRQSLDQPTGIAEVARFLGVSRNRFTERFRQETGQTPRQFLGDFRMDKACRLLRETEHSVAKVADLCGWRSATTFGALFRRRFGLPPGRYRRRERSC